MLQSIITSNCRHAAISEDEKKRSGFKNIWSLQFQCFILEALKNKKSQKMLPQNRWKLKRVPFTTQQLRNIGVLTAQLYNETDTTLQCTFQTSCSLTHICNCNVPLSSVASYCTDSTTHKEVTCSAHTTKNANPHK